MTGLGPIPTKTNSLPSPNPKQVVWEFFPHGRPLAPVSMEISGQTASKPNSLAIFELISLSKKMGLEETPAYFWELTLIQTSAVFSLALFPQYFYQY